MYFINFNPLGRHSLKVITEATGGLQNQPNCKIDYCLNVLTKKSIFDSITLGLTK